MTPPLAEDLETLPLAFGALMPLINPFGTALLILGMVGPQPPAVYEKLARQVAILMMGFAVAVVLLGQWLLHFFGISLPILQLGGGLTLAAMGWRTLAGKDPEGPSASAASESAVLERAFYPYTFPLTIGPGSIVVLITLSAHATRPTLKGTVLSHAGILLGTAVLSALVYVCYRMAPRLAQRLSRAAVNGIQQLMAFILLCIGGQISWGGAQSLLREVMTK